MPNGSPETFEPATGDGPGAPGAARAAEVRTAFESLLQIRRLTGGGDASAPAPWERFRMVRAVSLALEAAGFPPSAVDASGRRTATGYRVRAGDRPELVLVDWLGPPGSAAAHEETPRLTACAAALTDLGWEALLYKGPRGRRFLEVEIPPPFPLRPAARGESPFPQPGATPRTPGTA
ncbi:hypothetical protein QCN29_03130 [Streptomyces sp. HNM0663]|uniref:Uncharacterized protein n=1 Tax=Streptomyces chengmaiensis TaxID=3040919 RepID=A0ABT6HHM7_9ACTN|nr:hypothetical protein [Streptomyces chengmaiensis]MDH2387797.1 hypothetical protein [Streptomyces chengmaiensis]